MGVYTHMDMFEDMRDDVSLNSMFNISISYRYIFISILCLIYLYYSYSRGEGRSIDTFIPYK